MLKLSYPDTRIASAAIVYVHVEDVTAGVFRIINYVLSAKKFCRPGRETHRDTPICALVHPRKIRRDP